MILHKKSPFGKFLALCFLCFLFNNCIDPVTPEFEFKEGLIVIDAIASTTVGGSYVLISESSLKINSKILVKGASVSFKNSQTGEVVNLTEEEDIYLPPLDFVVSVGDIWELQVTMEDGRQYQSLLETVLEPVAIKEISASYNPELVYREDSDKFVPGHAISVSLDNDVNKENYLYWKYRSFEAIDWCKRCFDGSVLRNGVCVEASSEDYEKRKTYYDYSCQGDSWKIRYSENINIFEDKFVDTPTIENLEVAEVLLYTKANIVVELQQFSLTPASFEYYKILRDITDNNGGFNAPPPAALIGNVFNPSNDEEYVLGRFTAAAASTKSIFINRNDITDPNIEPRIIRQVEECLEVCPPVACAPGYAGPPCPIVTSTISDETRYLTSITPDGWIN